MDGRIFRKQELAGEMNWWISGRRQLFAEILALAPMPLERSILEIGPGVGSNLGVLQVNEKTRVVVADVDQEALEYCAKLGYTDSFIISSERFPIEDGTFQFVLAADVLEHVPNDREMMSEISRVLQRGCQCVVTVPAFRSLWSEHDRLAGHQRRYRRAELIEIVDQERLEIVDIRYFNWILFVPTLVVKKTLRFIKPREYADATSIPGFLNTALRYLFTFDIRISKRIRIPFGISLLMIVKKL